MKFLKEFLENDNIKYHYDVEELSNIMYPGETRYHTITINLMEQKTSTLEERCSTVKYLIDRGEASFNNNIILEKYYNLLKINNVTHEQYDKFLDDSYRN